MTPRPNHLTKPEILSLWKNSRKAQDSLFRIMWQPQTTHKIKWLVKVGVSASKKATHRNRSRRLVDEALKAAVQQHTGSGTTLLLIVKRDLYLKNLAEVKTLLKPLLNQVL